MLDQTSSWTPERAAPARRPMSSADPATDTTTNRKNMELLVQLRWTAVIGQIATITVTQVWFGIALPLGPMLAVIAALVLLNLVSMTWTKRRNGVRNRELFLALTLDVAALTAQLYLSGGATNPFTSLYLLQVTLGAVLLHPRASWSLLALTCVCFAGLAVAYRPLAIDVGAFDRPLGLYTAGMFTGFVLDAVLLVVFVTRINRNLRERDAHLAFLRQQAAEEDHIVRMGLLASGAAHELGTPLASMSVIVNDWRHMAVFKANPDIAEDMGQVEASLQRCKTIVTGILLSAGEARGEGSAPTTVNEFLAELVEEWQSARSVTTLAFENSFGSDLSIASDAALKQVVFNVLDNAFEASPGSVELVATRDADALVLSINDRGPGFSEAMLAELGKPYHSSKGRPGGGLGLFLVVNVVRKLGGGVAAHNRPNGGASVILTLPLTTLTIGDGRVR